MAVAGRRHLLVVATNYSENSGGVQTHLAQLCPRLVERNVAVTIVYLGQRARRRVEGGVEIVSLRRRGDVGDVVAVPDPRDWRGVVRLIRSGRLLGDLPTHVSTHTRFFPMSALGVRLGRRLAIPVVHTEHGSDFVATGRSVIDRAARAVDVSAGARVLRRADRVLVVSREVGEFVHRLSGRESTVFGNGADLALWRGSWPDRPRPHLLFVGRLVDEKGWSDFLEVVRVARTTHPQSWATIAGDGPRRAAVERSITERGLKDVVTMAGFVDQVQLAALAHGAVYVNPSVASEGLQTTLPETLAAGSRVVTYDVPGTSNLKAAGAPVSIVSRGDVAGLAGAVLDELSTPSAAATLEQLAPWDWETLAERYVEILDEVTEARLDRRDRRVG